MKSPEVPPVPSQKDPKVEITYAVCLTVMILAGLGLIALVLVR